MFVGAGSGMEKLKMNSIWGTSFLTQNAKGLKPKSLQNEKETTTKDTTFKADKHREWDQIQKNVTIFVLLTSWLTSVVWIFLPVVLGFSIMGVNTLLGPFRAWEEACSVSLGLCESVWVIGVCVCVCVCVCLCKDVANRVRDGE